MDGGTRQYTPVERPVVHARSPDCRKGATHPVARVVAALLWCQPWPATVDLPALAEAGADDADVLACYVLDPAWWAARSHTAAVPLRLPARAA